MPKNKGSVQHIRLHLQKRGSKIWAGAGRSNHHKTLLSSTNLIGMACALISSRNYILCVTTYRAGLPRAGKNGQGVLLHHLSIHSASLPSKLLLLDINPIVF
eukprot:6186416-Pleurochrysis_carterae.AAC.3